MDDSSARHVITNLGIAPSTVQATDSNMKQAYDKSCHYGCMPCANHKIQFVGDPRVGKTSTQKLLTGEAHDPDEPPTFGIKTQMVKTTKVDRYWQRDKINVHKSEYEKAAAYFAVNKQPEHPVFLQGRQTPPLTVKLIKYFIFLLILFSAGFLIELSMSFKYGIVPLLFFCCLLVGLVIKNVASGVNIGSGAACVMVGFNFLATIFSDVVITKDQDNVILWRLGVFAVSFFLGSTSGFLAGFILALGVGAGLMATLCLFTSPMQRKVFGEEISFTNFIDRLSYASMLFDRNFYSNFSFDILNKQTIATLCLLTFFLVGLAAEAYFQKLKAVHKRKLSISAENSNEQQYSHDHLVSKTVFHYPTQFVIVPILVSIVYRRFGSHFAFFCATGYYGGTAFLHGQNIGRHVTRHYLHIGHTNFVRTFITGSFIGIVYANIIGWRIEYLDVPTLCLGLSGAIFCIYNEYKRYNVKRQETYPVEELTFFIEQKSKGNIDWPTMLSLWDYAGDELYHEGHHVFMSSHAIYILVFSMVAANQNKDQQLKRLLFWLNSIFNHAHHQDSIVFLVGTHKADVGVSDQQLIGHWLDQSLSTTMFGSRLVRNQNKDDNPLFIVENRKRESNDEDITSLQEMVLKFADDAEYSQIPVAIKWFKFLDYIKKCRHEIKEGKSMSYILDIEQVRKLCRNSFDIAEESDFFRMLLYFHKRGEIIYRGNNPILCQYIIVDPQIMIDCIRLIIECKVDHPKFYADKEDLEQSGKASISLLKYLLQDVIEEADKILVFLQALDFMVDLNPQIGTSFNSAFGKYVVPAKLPIYIARQPLIATGYDDDDRIFYFDFGCLYPQSLFLRLLAKCYQVMEVQSKRNRINYNADDILLYKNYGRFYSKDLTYTLELCSQNEKQNFIKLSVLKCKKRTDLLKCCNIVYSLLKLIQRRNFKYLQFNCGIVCQNPNCITRLKHGRQHLYILAGVDHQRVEQPVKEFPASAEDQFVCGDIVTTIEFPEVTDTEDVSIIELPVEHYDIFISCCPEDSAWVQCEILPVLVRIPPVASLEWLLADKLSTTDVGLSYNNSSEDGAPLHGQSAINVNLQYIKYAKCVIFVLTPKFLLDKRCMTELDSAILRHIHGSGITVIPIVLKTCRIPEQLKTFQTLNYEKCHKQNSLDRFYSKLHESIKCSGNTR